MPAVKQMQRESVLTLQLRERHAVKHHGFVALEGDGGNDDEIALEFVSGGEDVVAGVEAGDDDVVAEVGVLDGNGVEACRSVR